MEGQEVTGNLTIGECEDRDLKSCDLLGRAGSIPALGTSCMANNGLASSVFTERA